MEIPNQDGIKVKVLLLSLLSQCDSVTVMKSFPVGNGWHESCKRIIILAADKWCAWLVSLQKRKRAHAEWNQCKYISIKYV